MLLFRSSYRSSTSVAFRSAFEKQTWNVNGFRWRAARATEKCRPLSRPTSNGSGAAGAAPVDFCRTRTTSHGPTQHHLSQHSLCQTSTTSAGPVHSSLGRATGRAHRIPPLQQPGLLFLASGLPASAACRQEGCEEGNALQRCRVRSAPAQGTASKNGRYEATKIPAQRTGGRSWCRCSRWRSPRMMITGETAGHPCASPLCHSGILCSEYPRKARQLAHAGSTSAAVYSPADVLGGDTRQPSPPGVAS